MVGAPPGLMRSLLVRAAVVTLVAAGFLAPARAQKFESTAPYAFLMDAATGAVLFEKAADDLVPPASMVKLMTAAVVFEEIRRGRIKPADEFTVSENAWRRGGAPSRGSTMFLVLGSRVPVADLISGLIVHSGNDAAIVLAEGIAGSEENFARLMTERARAIGLKASVFRNASGMADPDQKSTMRELGLLAAHIIATYPADYAVFGAKEFTWNRIKQSNRNPLLTMDIGADGLKTGNIAESGFGLVGSAVRDGRRLIVAVSGLPTAKDRAQEARKLLDWGFRAFEEKLLFRSGAEIGSVDVFGGETATVPVVAGADVRVLVPRGARERLQAQIVYSGPLNPPIAKGQVVARLRVKRGDLSALDIPLLAASDVGKGGLSRRAVDSALEFGRLTVRKLVRAVRG